MMKLSFLGSLALVLAAGVVSAAEAHKLEKAAKLPNGLAEPVAAILNPTGYLVMGPDGPVCSVWLAKNLEVKPGFTPSLAVKYPFLPGQLIGALEVPEKSNVTDFRGQEIPAGVYTLRYGQQPEDGNHIGTSELADFLLALPAKLDADPKLIAGFDQLAERSAKTAGSTHPAIFSLLPAEKAPKAPSLMHDESKEFWILEVAASSKQKDGEKPVPLRLVVIGKSDI
jgi:hypothetical protein